MLRNKIGHLSIRPWHCKRIDKGAVRKEKEERKRECDATQRRRSCAYVSDLVQREISGQHGQPILVEPVRLLGGPRQKAHSDLSPIVCIALHELPLYGVSKWHLNASPRYRWRARPFSTGSSTAILFAHARKAIVKSLMHPAHCCGPKLCSLSPEPAAARSPLLPEMAVESQFPYPPYRHNERIQCPSGCNWHCSFSRNLQALLDPQCQKYLGYAKRDRKPFL